MKITGTVKLIDFPDDACLTTVKDLLMDLERYLAIELPVESITNVVVSSSEPDLTDRDIIWYRVDNSGNFIGQFVYVQGEWLQMFPPPQAIFKMYGSSLEIPPGYALITAGTPGMTDAMVDKLRLSWSINPQNQNEWVLFDVVYVGL